MIDSVQQLGLSDYETILYKAMFLLQFYFGLRIGEITDSQHNITLSEISIQTDHITLSFYAFTSSLPVLEQDMTMYEMRALHGHVPLFSFILSHSIIHYTVDL